jgi:hypothetical protein
MNLENLRKLVNEVCDTYDAGEPHQHEHPQQQQQHQGKEEPSGGKMARTDLVTIAKDAQELVNMFGDDAELDDWVEAKITKAADYINSVKKHLGGEIVRQHGGLMEEGSSYSSKKTGNRVMPDKGVQLSRTGVKDLTGQDVAGTTDISDMGDDHKKKVKAAKSQSQLSKDFLASRPGSKSPRARKMLINKYKKMGLKKIPPFDVSEEVTDLEEQREVYLHLEDATYDDGTSVEEDVEFWDDVIMEAEYQGRKVTLNKPMQGDVKKSKVYVKNEKGNVVKVNFGDPNMKIKKSNPARRKSFRARHNCKNPGPKTKARYWSCKAW